LIPRLFGGKVSRTGLPCQRPGKGARHGRHRPPRGVLLRDGAAEAGGRGLTARRAASGGRQPSGLHGLPQWSRRPGGLRARELRRVSRRGQESQVEAHRSQASTAARGRRSAGRHRGDHAEAGRRQAQRDGHRCPLRRCRALWRDPLGGAARRHQGGAHSGSGVMRLALHTWTLDATPLADALAIAKATGGNGVALRRLAFRRAEESGKPADSVLDLVRASGLPVACVGVEFGWMWADGAERTRLLAVFDEQCRRAAALGCATVMSPVDKDRGDVARAVASAREVGDIAARHGVRLALEFNSQCTQLNTLAVVREITSRAAHPNVGLLLDTYHLGRSGATLKQVEDVAPGEIAYVQFSDPPRTGLQPGKALDRLPPGQGSYSFREFFALMASKGYAGFASYEAPNEAAWKRDPNDV